MWIFLGAGVGGVMRHWLGHAVHSSTGVNHFPIGTFAINVIGCLAIGFFTTAFAESWAVRDEIKLAVIVGILGGFTTFSSFGRETIQLFHDNRPAAAVAYILLSNAIAITSTWIGYLAARRLLA
jgi:CrcB protein